ncbi:MAG: class I SAM-dependent methyltransferase [Stackebrandtia sp.]
MNDTSGASYAFDNASEESKVQMAQLQAFLDPLTFACFSDLGVEAGARCLELGAGGGSAAHWLADRVGPDGEVVAVDIDPGHVASAENLKVLRHDIRDGVPDGGFDLIHARLVLMHIPERREVLGALVEALRPGGWLVVGEFSPDCMRVISSRRQADADLHAKIVYTLREGMSKQHGMNTDWAYEAHDAMLREGLRPVHSAEHAESWTGGSGGALLFRSNSRALQSTLLNLGVTREEIERYGELMLDPEFCARSLQFVNTWGRKTAAS